jgi:hypothetical protein
MATGMAATATRELKPLRIRIALRPLSAHTTHARGGEIRSNARIDGPLAHTQRLELARATHSPAPLSRLYHVQLAVDCFPFQLPGSAVLGRRAN